MSRLSTLIYGFDPRAAAPPGSVASAMRLRNALNAPEARLLRCHAPLRIKPVNTKLRLKEATRRGGWQTARGRGRRAPTAIRRSKAGCHRERGRPARVRATHGVAPAVESVYTKIVIYVDC